MSRLLSRLSRACVQFAIVSWLAMVASCGGGSHGDGGGGGTTEPNSTPRTGALTITTTTSGAEADVDGYTVAVDNRGAQAIGSNGSLVITGLAAGSHAIALGGVAANCTVDGGATHGANVVGGDTVTAAFSVPCHSTTGAITVTVTTTGDGLDSDGYTVILADTVISLATSTFNIVGDSTLARIATNGSFTADTLPPGNYAVILDGLAVGCKPTGGPWVTVPVVAADTAAISITVDCHTPDIDAYLLIHTSTHTAGSATPPDGYVVSVNFGDEEAVGRSDDNINLRLFAPGPVFASLRDVPPECTVDRGNVHQTEIISTTIGGIATGDAAGFNFEITCGENP